MSLKKTWFSYVLWLVFMVPAVFISYNVLTVVLQDFYAMLSSYVLGYDFYIDLGAKILTIFLVVILVVFVRYIFSRIKKPAIPRWLGITGHILLAAGIIAGFCVLRYPAINYAYYWQYLSRTPSEQTLYFFELSKVGSVTGTGVMVGTVSILEQAYIYVIHTAFLFLGNKLEIMFYAQLVLQLLTFILLIVIGRIMQRGIFAWFPALLYAVTPSFFYMASDTGISNFWIFIVVFGVFLICLFEKVWKNKNITYLVMVFVQLLFAGFVFYTKKGVLLFDKAPFVSGGTTLGAVGILDAEMLVLSLLLIVYCVTFFMDKQDHRSLFVIPFAGFGILFVWLSNYEYEISCCLMLLTMLNLFFLFSQSARVVLRTKSDVVTGKSIVTDSSRNVEIRENDLEPAKFEWDEMKEVMHSTEGVGISTGLVNVELPITDIMEQETPTVPDEEKINARKPVSDIVIDRKAPIENVLPMPKKHKPRVLDYAFNPTKDMMHYDIEIENDEYDY